MKRTHRHAERGFTLIELMVVVAIMGILAVLATPSLRGLYRRSALATQARILYSALAEARGLSTAGSIQHNITIDRAGRNWVIRADDDGDGVFERTVRLHPQTGEMPAHVAFGPAAGVTTTFPTPYSGISANQWCTAAASASATTCEIRFDEQGRITDDGDSILSGAMLLHDSMGTSNGDVQAIIFVGATGDIRLMSASE